MLAPQKGTYLLDIFSAKYPNYEMCQKKEATKYINVCRFRVNCTGVDKVNVPLPECAPGKCNSSSNMINIKNSLSKILEISKQIFLLY